MFDPGRTRGSPMRRRIVSALPTLAVAVASMAVGTSCGTATGTAAEPVPSTPSLELPGNHPAVDARAVLAAGVITAEDGSPVPGATVGAYGWPADIDGEVGEEFSLTPLGTTETDESGAYEIVPDYSVLRPVLGEELSGATEPVAIDIDIVAMTEDASVAWGTTVWVSPDLRSAVVAAADTHADDAVRRLATTPHLDEEATPIFDLQLMSVGEGG